MAKHNHMGKKNAESNSLLILLLAASFQSVDIASPTEEE